MRTYYSGQLFNALTTFREQSPKKNNYRWRFELQESLILFDTQTLAYFRVSEKPIRLFWNQGCCFRIRYSRLNQHILSFPNLFHTPGDYSKISVYFELLSYHLSFIKRLEIYPTCCLHLIFLNNVGPICITETSGTYFVRTTQKLNHYFKIYGVLWQTCFSTQSKSLDQNFFHCPIFLTAIL